MAFLMQLPLRHAPAIDMSHCVSKIVNKHNHNANKKHLIHTVKRH